MTLEETRQKILIDDEFVLEESRRLRYLYGLKKEIRYALSRSEPVHTESVAEHVYGMHILAGYFLSLEDTEESWDYNKIQQLITWHDTDEIETGDVIAHKKTSQDRVDAKLALTSLFQKMPEVMRFTAENLLSEYENQQTAEARFTKAIDKVEPLIECLDEASYIKVHHQNGFLKSDSIRIKRPYTERFPYINRFCDVLNDHLDKQGYFPVGSDKIIE